MRRPALSTPSPPPAFTLAKYVLDFGNVIKGMQRKKIFRLKNVGWQPVSLDIDKNILSGMGLRVEPDKVLALPLRHTTIFAFSHADSTATDLMIRRV